MLFVSQGTNVKTYYLIGGTSALSVYLIAIAAYAVSAIQRRDWGHWLFAALMFLILSTGVAACLSLASDILQQARHPTTKDVEPVPNRRWRRILRSIPVLASSVLCWVFAGFLVERWIWLCLFDNGNGIITGFRAVHLRNGVSPLPPLFFVSLAALFWTFCSIRRLHLNEQIPSILPSPAPDSSLDLPHKDRNSLFSIPTNFLSAVSVQSKKGS